MQLVLLCFIVPASKLAEGTVNVSKLDLGALHCVNVKAGAVIMSKGILNHEMKICFPFT